MSKHNAKQNEHIQVFIRCRPLLKNEQSLPVPVEVHPEVNKILVRDTGIDRCAVKSFSFDRVFGPDTKQADIYAEAVAPIIQEVIMGFNCTIFAYGQTGTGKTFTIEGGRTPHLKDLSEDPLCGIIPRSMKHLFNELMEQDMKFEICVSFLELYNEEIFDLLSKTDDAVKLRMFDNSARKGSVIVQGLEVRSVTSMKEVYEILDTGFKKRRKAATLLNKTSSRSHTIFTVIVNLKECSTTFEKVRSGKLNLVDLAGSENIGRSGAVDKRAREAGNINQSLLALGRVITSLCENAGHIPYRESKLTRLLQDSLGGQTKTAVIATISPSAIHVDETLNTLEYALRAKNITNRPELNTQVSVTSLTKDYLKEMSRLKKEIHEWGIKNDFYMPEEHLQLLESTLASKREEKFRILTQIASLMEEDKALDAALQEANNNRTAKRNQLEEEKLRCEEYRQMLEKEKEDQKLHEGVLQVMQPLYDHLHEKLHEDIKEKRKVESEVEKAKEKLLSALEEQRELREKFKNLSESQKKRQEKLHLNSGNLLENIGNVHNNVTSLTSECNNYVSLLKNGFESATILCESEFRNLSRSVNDLEGINKSFQDDIALALHEEKSAKLKGIDEFYEAYLSSNETSVLEPLNNCLKDCESSLLGISSALNDWKNLLSSELNTRQNLLYEYLDNQKTALQSMNDSVSALIKKEKENLEEYNNLIAECAKSETTSKTLWNDRFLAVELALSSLDVFCTDHMQNKIDKASQVSTHLMISSKLGSEVAEKLTSYCESASKNIEDVQKDMDFYEMNTFSRHWEEMKNKVDVPCMKYKNLNSELAKFSSISQDVDGLPNRIEDTLKNKFTDTENSAISARSQEMINSILKCRDSYQTCLLENQTEIDALLSNAKLYVEKLTENSNLLSESTNKKVPDYKQCIETELLKILTEDNTEVNDSRIEDSIEDTTFHGVTDITITSDHLEDVAPENGNECPMCANKIAIETLHSEKNGSHAQAEVQCSKNPLKSPVTVVKVQSEASKSRSFMSNCARSPVRRPRSRNALPPRRNLQFPDVEKLAHQLLQSSSDEEL